MAEAKAIRIDRTVVKEVIETQDLVELTLTREEALVLFAILYRVGGSTEFSHRKNTEAIAKSIGDTYPEIRYGSFEYTQITPLLEGHLIFKETPNG